MQVKVQVVTLRDDGEESLHEVACVERDELTPASLGLSIADSKAILQGIQEVVVEWQMRAYLDSQRHCPQCGKLRHSKGVHHTVFRTVFGDLPVDSPRFTHCRCQAHATESFSPLAELLPERANRKNKQYFCATTPAAHPQPHPLANTPHPRPRPTALPACPGQHSGPTGARRAKGWGGPARLLGGWTGAVGWGRVGPPGATRAEWLGERWGGQIQTGLQTLGGVDRPRSTPPPPARRPRDLTRRLRLPSQKFLGEHGQERWGAGLPQASDDAGSA